MKAITAMCTWKEVVVLLLCVCAAAAEQCTFSSDARCRCDGDNDFPGAICTDVDTLDPTVGCDEGLECCASEEEHTCGCCIECCPYDEVCEYFPCKIPPPSKYSYHATRITSYTIGGVFILLHIIMAFLYVASKPKSRLMFCWAYPMGSLPVNWFFRVTCLYCTCLTMWTVMLGPTSCCPGSDTTLECCGYTIMDILFMTAGFAGILWQISFSFYAACNKWTLTWTWSSTTRVTPDTYLLTSHAITSDNRAVNLVSAIFSASLLIFGVSVPLVVIQSLCDATPVC